MRMCLLTPGDHDDVVWPTQWWGIALVVRKMSPTCPDDLRTTAETRNPLVVKTFAADTKKAFIQNEPARSQHFLRHSFYNTYL